MTKRFYAIFLARNKEFFRDRSSLWWNFMFPFLLILGFSVIFQSGAYNKYKIGVVSGAESPATVPDAINNQPLFRLIHLGSIEAALLKLKHHKLDLVVGVSETPLKYWISDTSPQSQIAESILIKTLSDAASLSGVAKRELIKGKPVRYIDWVFPGIIAMNMMFSALFGVGYVIVRYRKNGVLKRFKATPLSATEYLTAQVVSRMFVILFTGTILFAGCTLLFDFRCYGSYLQLLLFFSLGSASIISMGMVVASRTSSEELANGLLNLCSWPMMFLSEVWFSLEGAPGWLQRAAELLPLSHVTEGMRRIINDGAGLADLGYEMAMLTAMTLVFMGTGSLLFKWTES